MNSCAAPLHSRRSSQVANRRRAARSLLAAGVTALLLLASGGVHADTEGGLFDSLFSIGERLGLSGSTRSFLEPEKAFVFTADILDPRTLSARWRIAEGYYLYRDKFSFRLLNADGVVLGVAELPHGEFKEDESFGLMEVYYGQVQIRLPLQRSEEASARVLLEASYQGCADDGFCYPPMKQAAALSLPPLR